MEDLAQPLLELIKAHSDLAAVGMFVTAFGESFAFIRGGGLGGCCDRFSPGRDQEGNTPVNEFQGQRRQPLVLTVRPTVFYRYVLTLEITMFGKALMEPGQQMRRIAG